MQGRFEVQKKIDSGNQLRWYHHRKWKQYYWTNYQGRERFTVRKTNNLSAENIATQTEKNHSIPLSA